MKKVEQMVAERKRRRVILQPTCIHNKTMSTSCLSLSDISYSDESYAYEEEDEYERATMLLRHSKEEIPESDMSCDMSSISDEELRDGIEVHGDSHWWLNSVSDLSHSMHGNMIEHDSHDSMLFHRTSQDIVVSTEVNRSHMTQNEMVMSNTSGIDAYQCF